MKKQIFLAFTLLFLLSACKSGTPGCPPVLGAPSYLTVPPAALPTSTPGPSPTPDLLKIGGKTIPFDKVVEGPLCNDTWSGTVYVTCNVQVYPWQDQPTFLKGCNLKIEPGTIVYVAYHHDAAYYNGCSCHTGESTQP